MTRTTYRAAHRAARRAAPAVLAAAAMLAAGAPAAAAAPAPAAAADPASYVNPIIGTGSGGTVVGQVDSFPGAAAPFGMLTFSPDTTPSGADGGGYYYGDSQTTGFSLTHISGPGCGAFGDIPILPTAGAVPSDPYTTTEPFSHSTAQASPGFYSVRLGPASAPIGAQLTATTRTGLADFSFPSGSNGNVVFKVAGSQNGDTNDSVQVVGNDAVTGQTTSGHFCGSPDTYPLYFAARFDRPFASAGTWQQSVTGPNLLGTSQTGTLGWGGPDNNGCATNTGALTPVDGGAGESWTASCVTGQTWAQVTPSGLASGHAYQASVTLEANSSKQTAPVFLDFYNGCVDSQSQAVSLTPGTPVTLTDTTTIGCSNTPQFQVRTSAGGSVDLTATNASIRSVVENPNPGATSASGPDAAAYTTFAAAGSSKVQMQVAISYVSQADAWANLAAEQGPPDVNFSNVQRATRRAWDRLLGKIRIGGGTTDQRTQFYTALYHSLLDPSVFSDANGQYLGFDGKPHTLRSSQKAQYANFSGWDVYRSEMQLLSLVAPAQTGDMMQSLVNDGAQGGWLPKWEYADDYTNVMNGDAADAMIADAYAFGVRNFDVKAALAEMVKGATEVPKPSQLGHGWYPERPQIADYLKLGSRPTPSRRRCRRSTTVRRRPSSMRSTTSGSPRSRPGWGRPRPPPPSRPERRTGRTCSTRPPATCSPGTRRATSRPGTR
ncbi:glycoside hydrolase family 92 protein [Acidiferrimicrobium sp. IK]|nr:glycoside hydrolase family 92 protein [Acidiferrimicrobium sp. IK]